MGAYTGGGLSLVDAYVHLIYQRFLLFLNIYPRGMVPFQGAYLMICTFFLPTFEIQFLLTPKSLVGLIFVILAGNHALVRLSTLAFNTSFDYNDFTAYLVR